MLRLTILIVAVFYFVVNAQAQVGVAGGAVMGTLIDSLEQSIANTINRADDAVSNNSFKTRQHLEILLSQLNSVAENQRSKTFEQLDLAQQTAFLNIKNSVEQLAQLERVTASDAQKTSLTVGTALGNLPLGKNIPRVIDYSPSYVLAPAPGLSQTTVVSVSGILLGAGAPKLTMNGGECENLSKTEVSLQFSCKSSEWAASDAVTNVAGQLTIYQKKGFLQSLFGKSADSVQYKVVLFVVPPRMGEFSLSAVRKVSKQRSNARNQEFVSHNEHCSGGREILFPFNAMPGWTIDPASIKANCTASQSSHCDGLRNVAATSFGYLGRVVNSGQCAPRIFNHRAFVDARGAVYGSMTWVESQSYEELVTAEVGTGILEWGRAIRIPLEPDTQSVNLTIKQIDGKQVIVTADDLSQAWYVVKVDRANQFLLVSPRKLEIAMLN
jgi:hypothetical protein